MRDGVVDVEEVELVIGGDFGHARGEGEVVGRVFEERVVGDGDFVKLDVLLAAAEAEGLRVGDEVDLVASGGELDAELGGDDSAAAVGGIAGDSDLHGEPGYRVQGAGVRVQLPVDSAERIGMRARDETAAHSEQWSLGSPLQQLRDARKRKKMRPHVL